MNSFINIFFVFIFLFAMLLCKIPNINNNNFIIHKLLIFGLLFGFQFLLLTTSHIKNKCKIDFLEIFRYSIETAILGIIGYSLFTDLRYTTVTSLSTISDNKVKYLYIAIIVSLLLVFVNTIKLLFGYRPYECIKY
jgi:hypothetical protein